VLGLVLAAGGGSRLRPLTDQLPKTLLPVDGDRSILEIAVANLAANDIKDIHVAVGHAAEAIETVAPTFEERYGVAITIRHNPRYAELNNAYTVWLVRDLFERGVLLVNGDTVHPASFQAALLDSEGDPAPVVIAVDRRKRLADEEMKVRLDDAGHLTAINKTMDPATAQGEYIGLTLIQPSAADGLADALERTFTRDGNRWYEDGFAEFASSGGTVGHVPMPEGAWVEVDDHDDLSRAREIAPTYRS
jgi:choline kinase